MELKVLLADVKGLLSSTLTKKQEIPPPVPRFERKEVFQSEKRDEDRARNSSESGSSEKIIFIEPSISCSNTQKLNDYLIKQNSMDEAPFNISSLLNQRKIKIPSNSTPKPTLGICSQQENTNTEVSSVYSDLEYTTDDDTLQSTTKSISKNFLSLSSKITTNHQYAPGLLI